MKILHVSYSREGGIGNVVSELVHAQRSEGHEADWIFATSGPLRKTFLSHPVEALRAGVDDSILRNPKFGGPISVLRTGRSVSRKSEKLIKQYDVVHLHGGSLDFLHLSEHLKHDNVVVTHHDMRPVTVACHQSLGCVGFKLDCRRCPAVKSEFAHLVKPAQLKGFPASWRHSAPSPCFASLIQQSKALEGRTVAVVPNPLPEELLSTAPGGENNEFLTILGSSAYSPLRAISRSQLLHLKTLASQENLRVVSIGGNQYPPDLVENLGICSRKKTFDVISKSRYCFSPTKFESFSTVGLESLYLGALLIAPLDSPQGELSERLGLRVDPTTLNVPEFRSLSINQTKTLLDQEFGVKVVVEKFRNLYQA